MLVSDIKAALKKVSLAKCNSSIAVLHSVVIDPNRIWMTNMEASISVAIETGVNSRCIPDAAQLTKVLSALKAKDDISFAEGQGGSLQVTSRIGKTTLTATAELDDVPVIAWTTGGGDNFIPEGFYDRLVAVSKFASKDEGRPILMSTRLECDGETFNMVATDSYSLAKDCVPYKGKISCQAPINVYLKALDDISYVDSTDGYLTLSGGDTVVRVRELEGAYPNWTQLVPTNHELEGSISEDIIDSLKFVCKLDKKNNSVKMSINGNAKLSFKMQDGPEHESEHAFDGAGEEMIIGYNSGFLLKCLEYAGLSGKWISPLRPTVFGDRDGKLALLMPTRLPG